MSYVCLMKLIRTAITTFAFLTPFAAMASTPTPIGPNGGTYGNWIAATYGSGSHKICYAFTKPKHSSPALSGRGTPMLTVSERHSSRDDISITPGYNYPSQASVTVTVGNVTIPFYAQGNIAFTEKVSKALLAFKRGYTATTTATGPSPGTMVTDEYSLSGFTDAYDAIVRACP